jgi:hypothetical protein
MTNFKRAKEVKIFDEKGNEWLGQKGLVNEANEWDRFAIVGTGYKIAQHDEVYEIVDKALNDLKIEHKTSTLEMNEGARLRIDLKFPEIVHSIAGEQIQLWATFDNSYNSSTGLRLEINAYMPVTDTNLYCSEVISEKMNKYYHRHTKGLEVGMLEGTISRGIEIFQKEIGKEFDELVNMPVNAMDAAAFFSEMLENKTVKTAKKYLVRIIEALGNVGDKVNTAWGLYSLVSSILTKEVASVDLRRNNARELLSRIKKNKWQ